MTVNCTLTLLACKSQLWLFALDHGSMLKWATNYASAKEYVKDHILELRRKTWILCLTVAVIHTT